MWHSGSDCIRFVDIRYETIPRIHWVCVFRGHVKVFFYLTVAEEGGKLKSVSTLP